MRFSAVAVALLNLLSVGLSVPVIDCGTLTRPIDIENREQLLGKWTTLAESTNLPASQLITNLLVDNSWVKVSAANDADGLDFVQYQKMIGACYSVRISMTLANNTLSAEMPLVQRETLLFTSCPDCLVVYAQFPTPSSVLSGLQFLSRRRKVTDAEIEEFKKQAQCLGLSEPGVLNTETVLCPEDSQSQETQSSDLTSTLYTLRDGVVGMMEELLTGEGGFQDLIKVITRSSFEAEPN